MLAARARKSQSSDLAELFKLSERSDVISFAGGFPHPSWFLEEIQEIGAEILLHKRDLALQYGPVPGLSDFREFVAGRMTKQGMPARMENILITSGALQGLDLVCKIYVDPGDLVLVESPTYLGAIATLRSYEAEIAEVPCDDSGLMVEELDKILAVSKKPKFIYTIPTFQNPSGRVMKRERRIKLLEWAGVHQIPIVEDSAYGELRFSGEEIPTLKALDRHGSVIFLGTFSKIFSPGVRLGWIAASKEIIDYLVLFKQAADQMSSTLSQLLAFEAGKKGLLEKQIAVSQNHLRLKRDLTIAALQKYFGDRAAWTASEGGFFTWVELKDRNIDTAKLLKKAIQSGVAYVAGPSFFVNGSGQHCLRICYSLPEEEQIEEGIKRLVSVLLD